MPRYLVERSFTPALNLAPAPDGDETIASIVGNNSVENVTWLHSYVTPDNKKTFCIYDAPCPEAIRRTAKRNGLPVDRITQVRVLDPYSYQASG
jgi:hypothetical protein